MATVTTIQQTSRPLKLQLIVSGVATVIGVAMVWHGVHYPGAAVTVIGLAWLLVTRMLIWWRHA